MRARLLLKEATDSSTVAHLRKQIKDVEARIDHVVTNGGRVGLGDPLSIRVARLRAKLSKLKAN